MNRILSRVGGCRRLFSSKKFQELPRGTILVDMPKLSPSMTHGRIKKWIQEPGTELVPYDLLMEITTDTLTEEAYKVGKFAGTVTMQIECVDHGKFVKRLELGEKETLDLKVGTPLALLCEDEDVLNEIENIHSVQDPNPDTTIYMNWNAYIKA